MDPLGALCGLGISGWLVVLLVFLLSRWYLTKPTWDKQPPGPLSLPVIGSLLSIPDKVFHKGFMKMAQTYGPIFKLDIGAQPVVVLNGHNLMNEALLKMGPVLSDRPHMSGIEYRMSKGVSAINGDTWIEQRRFLLHTLRNFGMGKNTMEFVIQQELQYLSNELQKFKVPLNPYQHIQKSVSNVFIAFALGRRMSYDDDQLTATTKEVERICTLLSNNGMLHFFPMLRIIPGDIFKSKELENLYYHLLDRIKTWINSTKADIDYNSSEPKDFIEAFLQESKKHEGDTNSAFTEEMLAWHILDLYGGSLDTTAATLTFGIVYMIRNPDIQAKVQAEIDDVIGRSCLPSFSQKTQLPFCEAVLSEIQRCADVLPLGLARAPKEDTVIRGYCIPKATQVLVNLHSANKDPEVWPEPHKFDPSRFLTDDGKYYNHPKFSPFGIGKRKCIGETMARRELFVMFVGLLQQFSFQLPEGAALPDPEGEVGLIMHPKPFKVIINKRT